MECKLQLASPVPVSLKWTASQLQMFLGSEERKATQTSRPKQRGCKAGTGRGWWGGGRTGAWPAPLDSGKDRLEDSPPPPGGQHLGCTRAAQLLRLP